MRKLVDHIDYEDDIQSCLGKKNDFTNYVFVQKKCPLLELPYQAWTSNQEALR